MTSLTTSRNERHELDWDATGNSSNAKRWGRSCNLREMCGAGDLGVKTRTRTAADATDATTDATRSGHNATGRGDRQKPMASEGNAWRAPFDAPGTQLEGTQLEATQPDATGTQLERETPASS